MVFYHNYVNQCNKKGMSPSAAAEAMGFKRSMVTRWKDGSQPRQATLQRMADFFGCSVTDLTEETKKAPADDGEGIGKLLEDLRDRPDLRGLLDAARVRSPEQVNAMTELLKQLKGD